MTFGWLEATCSSVRAVYREWGTRYHAASRARQAQGTPMPSAGTHRRRSAFSRASAFGDDDSAGGAGGAPGTAVWGRTARTGTRAPRVGGALTVDSGELPGHSAWLTSGDAMAGSSQAGDGPGRGRRG